MRELLAKLHKLTPAKKAGVTAGSILLLGLLFYQVLYSDLDAKVTSAHAHREALDQEKSGYERRKKEYLGYRAELLALEEEQREILRALPRRAEIPSFLAHVHEQAEVSGLEVLSVDIGQEAPMDLYVRIPVKMEVRGSYHQITRFFRNMGEMQRIVNVENLMLAPDREKSGPLVDVSGALPPKLRAKFVVAAFRYGDRPVPAPAPLARGGGS
jgi:type IV pilus assembly protein PilO